MTKPDTCKGCQLYNIGTSFATPEGDGTLGVLICGESLGWNEAQDGLPFRPRGESGAVLERVWRRCGYSREQFRITNICLCQPPGNKLEGASYKVGAIAHCKQAYLDHTVREMKPRCILALGGVATEVLTGMKGRKQGVASLRGFVLDSTYSGIPVVPSYHPAFLRRGKMSWLSILINDMMLAVRVAKEGAPPRPTLSYKPQASLLDADMFYQSCLLSLDSTIAYDIETAWSGGEDEHEIAPDIEPDADADPEPQQQAQAARLGDPVQIQFSLAAGTGIALPWTQQYISIIQRILQLPNHKIGFNSRGFDDGKLAEHGCPVAGPKDDVMLAWHHLQPDLPRGLQAVTSFYAPEFGPWKHESGMDLARYGCKDVDVLHRIWPKLVHDLRSRDLWRGYERHVRGLIPILDRASERGLPLDVAEQARFAAFLDEGLESSNAAMQAIVPDDLRIPSPKEGFVKDPIDTTDLVYRGFMANVTVNSVHYCDCVDLASGHIRGWEKKVALRCPVCKGTGIAAKHKDRLLASVKRWCRLEPFSPSSKQLISYMRHRGHKVPKAIGEDRESTAKIFLERMVKETKDPLYPAILEFRAMQKMKGSYLWSCGPDQRIHPTFTFSPATGQLAAVNPNVMTIPAPKGKSWKDQLAVRFRQTIAARPGYTLLECDASGFHTSTFALEAKDPDYFRLANKIRDPHSFLAAVMLNLATPGAMLAQSDEELVEFLNWVKKNHKFIRDGQAKPGILGFALGLGGNKLFEQNRYDPDTKAGFRSRREADTLVQTLRGCFSKCYQYQLDIRQLAHNQRFLTTDYGTIRHFWDVLYIDPRTGVAAPGEQAESAIAFRVQGNAHGYLKEVLLRLQEKGLLERYGLCNIVHDSVFFEVETALLEEAIYNVVAEMEQPSQILKDPILCPGGLVIAAEAKWGANMSEMKGS